MDFTTNRSDSTSLPFPDQGAQGTSIRPDDRGDNVTEKLVQARRLTSREFQPTSKSIVDVALTDVAGGREVLSSANSVPRSMLAFWTRVAQANMSVRMHSDLLRVAGQPSGWKGARSVALRESSLKTFLDFWTAIRDSAVEPELSLAPDGTLLAEWFNSPRQRLDARFVDHKVLFGLFANNRILEGAESSGVVAQILKSHPLKPLTWSAR